MHKHRIIACLLLTALSASSLTGCGITKRERSYEQEYSEKVITSIDDLAEDTFYVEKEDGYHSMYVGRTNFTGGSSSNSSSSRVAWFSNDFDEIPVMNAGDSIVYHSSVEFNESFTVERFEDLGYTIGICNMSPSSTGRYCFSTDPEDMNVNINSDAGILLQLGPHTAVMDRIGSVKLRSGNISKAGTILGLKKGKTYAAEIYIGTNLYPYNLVADVRALSSMEAARIINYEFTQSKTIRITFPSYFNSGYYYVSNCGFVKYIASGDEFSEDINMNIPNISTVEVTADDNERKEMEEADVVIERFILSEKDKYKVSVEYVNTDKYTAVPSAKLIGSGGAYTLNPGKDGTLSYEGELPDDQYRLEIVGLAGRQYVYKVETLQPDGKEIEEETSEQDKE